MRYRLTVKTSVVLPNGKAQRGAFVLGASARKNGRPVTANPHELYANGTFYLAWHSGWKGADAGDVDVEILSMKPRVYGQEIVRV